jgi:hypothetical protein
MLDIERPLHLMPSMFPKLISRANINPIDMEEDQGSSDNRPLAEVMKGKGKKTAQESVDSPGGDILPGHSRGPRATA